MRYGFISGVLVAGALVTAAVILERQRDAISPDNKPAEVQPLNEAVFAEPQSREQAATPDRSIVLPETAGDGLAKHESDDLNVPDEDHAAYVETRIAELEKLSTKHDRASLEAVLSEVRNPDKEIRQAALDALMQAGNRDAIPLLEESASQTTDSEEKQAIREAIEFLKMPTLTEVLTQGGQGTKDGKPVVQKDGRSRSRGGAAGVKVPQ